MSETYFINKIKPFCDKARAIAVSILSNDISDTVDIDEFITIKQCEEIVSNNSIKIDDDNRYLINEEIYIDIISDITEQIYQAALSKLAACDIIECAWDEEREEMVFWIQNDSGKIKINNSPLC